MKPILFILFSFCFIPSLFSQQNSWKVVHNGKVQLEAVDENEEENKARLFPKKLDEQGALVVNFKEAKPAKDWKRTIALYSETDELLEEASGNILKINNEKLKQLFKNRDVVKVYTWSLPTDPNEAARIRVRRVHLCTLLLN